MMNLYPRASVIVYRSAGVAAMLACAVAAICNSTPPIGSETGEIVGATYQQSRPNDQGQTNASSPTGIKDDVESAPGAAAQIVFDTDVVECQATQETDGGLRLDGSNDVVAPIETDALYVEVLPPKCLFGVDQFSGRPGEREPDWRDQQQIPWESFAFGEYLGPYRTPHVGEYRLRIRDQIDFVFTLTREHLSQPYQIYSGDQLQIFSGADPTLNQKDVVVLSDGTISLQLIGQVRAAGKTLEQLNQELDARYSKFVKKPAIIVQVTKGDTPANDLINAVVARFGEVGQSRQAEVTPDGTVSLPLVGQIPALGLTLRELDREVNARYATRIRGLSITPVLLNRAPRSVYVLGQVNRPGRIQIDGPTTVMQAISMAEGWTTGSNLRQIIVFRRDQDWRLMATKIDLAGALLGKRPHPADEIWLRDSDIILIPKTPIQRISEGVELYFTRTIYGIFPIQGVAFNFDSFQTF